MMGKYRILESFPSYFLIYGSGKCFVSSSFGEKKFGGTHLIPIYLRIMT